MSEREMSVEEAAFLDTIASRIGELPFRQGLALQYGVGLFDVISEDERAKLDEISRVFPRAADAAFSGIGGFSGPVSGQRG